MKLLDLKIQITKQLSPHTDTPQLDADLLLMHALKKTRAELLISLDDDLIETRLIDSLVARRVNSEPIAYILGHQPFWKLDLIVTPDVLIPRPETECLVEWILKKFSGKENRSVADLGTGSGAIAVALAHENKNWKIDAIDESYEALAVAKKNADKYHTNNISFYQGDWCDALPHKNYDVIVSNPPYIAENDVHLEKLLYEPQSALVSGKKGLDAIEKITQHAKKFLKPNGYLVIEHGFDQADTVFKLFKEMEFKDIQNHRDLSDISRFITGNKRSPSQASY